MMDCEQAILALSARGDGELDRAEAAGLEAHLATCESCRIEEGELARQDAALRRTFLPRRHAADRVASSVIAAVSHEAIAPKSRRVPLWYVPAALAAGFLIALIVPSFEGEAPTPVVALELAVAPVDVRSDGGEWERMASGAWIDGACDIRTERAPCELVCRGGARVRVDRGAQVRWDAADRVAVRRGRAMVVADRDATLSCEIGRAVVTARGAIYEARLEPDDAWRVLVLSGRVDVSIDGQHTTVAASSIFTRDGGVRPVEIDPVMDTRWVHPLLTLASDDSEELAERVRWLVAHIQNKPGGPVVCQPESEIRALGPAATVSLMNCVKLPAGAPSDHAARLLADLAPSWAVGDLVGLLGHKDPKIRFHAARGLERITGETLGIVPDKWGACNISEASSLQQGWVDWLRANGDRFTPPGNP